MINYTRVNNPLNLVNVFGNIQIINNETVNIYITVKTSEAMENELVLFNNTPIIPNSNVIIKPSLTGIYKVIITKGTEISEFYFTFVEDVINFFIKESLNLLCGTDCEPCKEKNKKNNCEEKSDCNPYNILINQIYFINHWLNIENYNSSYIHNVLNYNLLINSVAKDLTNRKFLGENCCFQESFFKRIIIAYYSGFYFREREIIMDNTAIINKSAALSLLDEKYNITKFQNCITNYGINLYDLQTFYP